MINLTKPIISVSWLNEHLQSENLVILDATIGKALPIALSNNHEKQIPNTRFFDLKQAFSDSSAPFPSTFPSEAQFTNEAQALGINKDSAIVVYDDKGIYSSARAWWLFKAMGHSNVAVLNGGFPEWVRSGYQVEERQIAKVKIGNFIAKYHQRYMKFFEDVKKISVKKESVIVDARSKERFMSLVDEPRAGLRRGHIPNSINLPYEDLLDGYTLKEESELKGIFETLIKKEDNITFSCGSGLTACILALGAEISGYKNLSVYDGSWTEWGSLTSGIMEEPNQWTKDELLAYILIYVSHSDLNESRKELEYIFSRVDKTVYHRVLERFENDSDYQSIQNIIDGVKTHDYYRNDLADLFADIKLMAFADGDFDQMEQIFYNQLKRILKDE